MINMNKRKNIILKGDIIYADLDRQIKYYPDSYLVCENGKTAGVFQTLPALYQQFPVRDCSSQLIVPGMSDLHVHAPQYSFRGLGMDLELLEWLNTHTFPEEAKYADISYARKAYEIFVSDLRQSTTTRACIFATIHNEATLILMDLLEQSGLHTFVGRVNMDRNGGENLCEENADISYKQTKEWILASQKNYSHTKPILTPRFIPSCTDKLMKHLSVLQKEFKLPVQSHLSENLSEIAWVKELVPSSSCYGNAYENFEMFGGEVPTIMAHCVYSSDEEIRLMKERNVFIAHCPESNINLASGIAPVRNYLDLDLHIGLGSDIAGGASLSLLRAMAYAIQSSKLYYRLIDQKKKPLSFEDVFYLATLGGGQFFGKIGTFLPDYEFDAVVLDDSDIHSIRTLTLKERMERLIYETEKVKVIGKYVNGTMLF